MAGISPILGFLGARDRAKADASQASFQNALATRQVSDQESQAKADEAYRQQELAFQQQQIAAQNQAAGRGPDGQLLPPLAIPKSLSQIIPNNHGVLPDFGTQQQAKVEHFQNMAALAIQQGRRDLADFYQGQARDAALNANSLANAGYTSGIRTALGQSQIDVNQQRAELLKAQTNAAWDLPQRQRDIATGHDAAATQRARLAIQSRQEIAQYSGAVREWVTTVAMQRYLQNGDAQRATQMAIAELNDRTRVYLQKTNPKSVLLDPNSSVDASDPTLQPPQPGAPVFNYNVTLPSFPSFPGGGSGAPSATTPQTGGAQQPVPAASDPTITKYVSFAKQALAAKKTPHDIRATLNQLVARGEITQQQAQTIEQQVGAQPLQPLPLGGMRGVLAPLPVPKGTPLAPLAVPTGGSSATSPF